MKVKKNAKKSMKFAKAVKKCNKSRKAAPKKSIKMREKYVVARCGVSAKIVIKDNGAFVRIWPDKNDESRMIRLHVFPNGHFNVQNKEQEGTQRVMAKGDI